MAEEREIKLNLKIPLKEFINRIGKLGYTLNQEVSQIDIYFDTDDWHLYHYFSSLRFRKVNNKNHSFTFKKVFCLPKRKNKYFVEEIEINSPFKKISKFIQIWKKLNINNRKYKYQNLQNLKAFLFTYGYFDKQIVKKSRTIYKHNSNEIVIDNVKNVGIIIELECKKDNPLKIVQTLLNKNEWDRNIEGTGYMWLKKVKGFKSHLTNQKRFSKEPDWNVWKHERYFYNSINKIHQISILK